MAQVHDSSKIDQMLAGLVRPEEDVLDDVYQKYADSHPFLPITHFIDHATMGAEALVGLGMGGHVREWISHHDVRPYEPPITGLPISSKWMQALGRIECHGDWIWHFEKELVNTPYADVLKLWIPRFAHECGAWLFHGAIRTGHAVRALEHRDSSARRRELARGLALWAIGVKYPPPARRHQIKLSDEALKVNPEAEIISCARAGAAAFVNKPTIPVLHLVTGPMAYLLMARHLDFDTHCIAMNSFLHTHADANRNFEVYKKKVFAAPLSSFDDIEPEHLAEQTNAHPIKLTEAALRAHRLTDDEIFLKAAGKVQNYSAWQSIVGGITAALTPHST
jgi:hypothetical protein